MIAGSDAGPGKPGIAPLRVNTSYDVRGPNAPVRTLTQLDIRAQGPYVMFDLSANGFLHHMVRNIVGSLVYVGCGRKDAAWLSALLAQRDRTLAAPTFDAAGLYLTGVDYDVAWQLPLRERVQSPRLVLENVL